jgi:hypothetical protein
VVAEEAGLKCLQYRPRGYGLITVPKVGMCTGGGWQLTWFKIEWLGVGADECCGITGSVAESGRHVRGITSSRSSWLWSAPRRDFRGYDMITVPEVCMCTGGVCQHVRLVIE